MHKKYLFFLLSTTLISASTIARPGGGSSGSGSSRGIGAILGLIYLLILTLYIHKKNKKAKQIIEEIHSKDSIWDYDQMIDFSKQAFQRMQNAWSERNMDIVKDMVTPEFYQDYKKQLDWLKVKHEQNLIEAIEIKKSEMIGIEDHLDNKFDSFTVYIKGKMVDYTISDKTLKIYTNKSKQKTDFTDLYYFVRSNDKWLLSKIDGEVTLGKVIRMKEFIE